MICRADSQPILVGFQAEAADDVHLLRKNMRTISFSTQPLLTKNPKQHLIKLS